MNEGERGQAITELETLKRKPNSTRPNSSNKNTGRTSENSSSACPLSDEVVAPRRTTIGGDRIADRRPNRAGTSG